MAFATGTATDHDDLWTKLLAFLKTNTDLVNAGQQWTEAWSASSTEKVLKGPGLSGDDQVYVGLKLVADAGNDSYMLYLRGMSGVISSGATFTDHVNVSPGRVMYLDANPVTYWFVANGRRFIVVLKISTVFETCYAGLFLPYSLPAGYPYPMFIGGTRGMTIIGTPNWRSVENGHTHFVSPYTGYYGYTVNQESSAVMLDPSGVWIYGVNNGDASANPKFSMGPEELQAGFGTYRGDDPYNPGYDTWRQRMRDAFGGGYAITPITMVTASPDDQTYGILDGCFHVPGFGNSSQNVVTVGGVDHLVVQNVFRTGVGNFWALALG